MVRDAESSPLSVVAMLTDFGLEDGYVGEMEAALARVCPAARVVHITHLVPPGDVRTGAYILGRTIPHFPQGTVFLAVVDPGVGTGRQPVIVGNRGCCFVGPDNGLFARAIDWRSGVEVRVIDWGDADSKFRAATFQGRDLFAPVAGRLARGDDFTTIGVPGVLKATFTPPGPESVAEGWRGEVVHIDRFGNIATNLPNGLPGRVVKIAGVEVRQGTAYGEGPEGELIWIQGSDGCIEIAINRDSAARSLGVEVGAETLLYRDGE